MKLIELNKRLKIRQGLSIQPFTIVKTPKITLNLEKNAFSCFPSIFHHIKKSLYLNEPSNIDIIKSFGNIFLGINPQVRIMLADVVFPLL